MNSEIIRSKIWDCTIRTEDLDKFFGDVNLDRSGLIIELLDKSLVEKNGKAVDNLVYAAFKNGVNESYTGVLCRLLDVRDEWQYKHEDIATLLGKVKSPESVPSLYRLVNEFEISDIHSIPLKAMWALRVIGNSEAEESLKNLCTNLDARKAKIAKQQLDYLYKIKEST